MPKKQSYYPKVPSVPAKKIAGTMPIGKPPLGNAVSPSVDLKPAVIHGLGIPAHPIAHPNVKGSHGFGHVAKHRQGHLRLSGSPGAHRVGKK